MKSNPRQGIIGNPTAGTTITNHRQPKRQKLELQEVESQYFAKGKGELDCASRRTVLSPSHHTSGKSHTNNARPLIVDDDDEDLGTPVNTDELNIIDVDSPFPPSSLSARQVERHRYGKAITSLAVRDTSGGSRIVKDGPATRRLEMNLDSQEAESDPIGRFSDDPEPIPMSRPGLVRERVSKIENADHTTGPRRDLRNDQPPRIKNQMKVKVTQSKSLYSED
jgi:hypothetical protein